MKSMISLMPNHEVCLAAKSIFDGIGAAICLGIRTACAAFILAQSQPSQAATLTWDISAGDGATVTGGAGTWTNGLGNWNTGAGDTTWNNANPDSAIFGGTAGTVTLGGSVTVGNMVFNSAYNLLGGGNTLTLSNSTITVSTSTTISAAIGGSTGLIKDGTGSLLLGGAGNYTGTTTINAGTLTTGPSGTLGTGDIVNNGTLVLGAFTGPTLSQTISGTGKININGGTVTFSGINTYTGVTTVAGGTNLLVSNIGDGGVAGNLGAASNAASNIVLVSNSGLNYIGTGSVTNTDRLFSVGLTGGTLAAQGTGAINFTNTGSMGFNGFSGVRTLTLTGTNTGNNSIAAAIGDNGGATSVTKSGASTWLLTGTSSSHTGVTTISSGVLGAVSLANGGTNSSLGAATNAATNLVLNGGTLRYTGSGSSTDRLFSVGTTAGSTLDASGTGAVNFTNTGSIGFNSQTGSRTLTLTGTNTGANTLAAVIGDNGGGTSLTKSGTGIWILTGANTYTGTTTITGGSLQIGSGGTAGTLGSGSVTDNGNLTFNRSDSISVSNTISGSGSFTQAGTGTTTLNGSNSYLGVTRITSGVLNVTTLGNGGSNSNIGASSNLATNLVLNGGTLKYSPGAVSAVSTDRLFSVGTAGGTIDASGGFNINFTNTGSMGFDGQSGTRTLTLTGNNANDNTLALIIGDNGGATSVTKAGGGIWVLSGANTYTGVTTVSGTAVLKVSSLANGGLASNIGASSNAASNLVFNGGTFAYTGAATSTDRLFSVGTSGITLNATGTGGINFTNTGNMGFNGQSGTRTIALANSFGGSSTIAAVIGDNGGATSVTRTNSGTWALTGLNTYTGATTINGGTLSVASLANGGAASGIGASTNAATNLVLNGGTLQYTGSGASTDRLFSVGTSGGTLDASGTAAVNFTNTGSMGFNSQTGARTLTLTGSFLGLNIIAAVIADNGGATSLTKTGSGKWVFTGANTYSGTTTVSAGVLQIGNNTAGGTFGTGNILNNATLVLFRSDTFTLSQIISGTGTLSNAAGTAVLTGLNTYTGFTGISAGTVSVDTLANGGSASNIGASTSVATNLQITGGTLKYTGAGVSTDRLFAIGVTATIDASGTGALNFANTGSMGFMTTVARMLTLTGSNTGNNTVAAVIGDNVGTTSLVKSSAGTWVLSGANTYTGTTTISGGTLSVSSLANGSSSSNIGASTNVATNLVLNGGTLQYKGSGASTDRLFSLGTSGGTLDASGTGALNFTNTGSMGFNAQTGVRTLTLTGTNAGSNIIAAVIGDNSGATSLTKTGAGTWVLTGTNTYTGTTTISAGILQIGNGGTTGTLGSGAVTDNAILIINRSNAITLSNPISGTGSLSQTGSGTTTLSGTNSYTGATIVSAGALSVSSIANSGVSSNIGASTNASANLILNGGTLQYTGAGASTDRLFSVGTSGGTMDASGTGALNFTNTGNMGFVSSGARSLTLTGSNTGSNTLAAVVGDNGGTTSLTKSGAGTWLLTGTNTYTGTTTISGGTLIVSSLANGGTSSNIGASSSAAANLVITNGGTLQYTGAATSTDRLLTVGSGNLQRLDSSGSGAVNFTNTGSISFSGALNGGLFVLQGTNTGANTFAPVIGDYGNPTSVYKQGGGTWALAGLNTYTSFTAISGGVLNVSILANGGVTSNIGASNNLSGSLSFNSGTLRYTGATVSTDRLFSLTTFGGTIDASGTGAVSFTNTGSMGLTNSGARTLTLTGSNISNNSLAAVIGDNSGATSVTKTGVGTWVLAGTNTYGGATTISGGTLSVSSLSNGGSSSNIGASTNVGTNLVLNGGTLQYTGSGASTDRLFSVGTSGGTLDASGTGALNFTNTGSMGFVSSGARSMTLTGSNTGSNMIAAAIGDNSGATSLTKTGTGTWVLTGTNTYTGTTTISVGTLQIGNGGTTGTLGNGAVTDNASLVINRSNAITLSNTISGTGSLTQAGSGTTTLTGTNTYTGITTISGGVLQIGNGGTTGILGTGAVINNASLVINRADIPFNVANTISGTGTVTQAGIGTTTLSATNSYTGATIINAGRLSVSTLADGGSNSGIGASSNAAANLVLNGGTLEYTGAATSTDRLFSVGTSGAILNVFGTGGINFTNTGSMGFNGQAGPRTLTLYNSIGGTSAIAAVIGDNGGATSVTLGNTAAWMLTGANTYTGATSILGGTLNATVLADGGQASSIGASTSAAANLIVLTTFRYIGAATSTDRLFSISTGVTPTLDASGTGAVNFTNTGSMGFVGSSARRLTLTGTNNGNNILAAIIGDNGGATSLVKSSTGTWVLTGNNVYTGATTITGGVLQIGNSGTSGSLGSGSVTNGASLVFNRSDTITVSNTISGTGSVTHAGTGTTILTGANSYNGGTTISAGILQIDSGGTTGALGIGAVTNNASLVINRSNTFALSNTITGSGSVTQAGTGTTTLGNANSYTGATVVNGGVLSVSTLANGGSNSSIGASSNAAVNLVLNGGTLQYTGSGASTDRLFSVGTSGGTLDASGTAAVNFTNTGTMGFDNQTGARTLTLAGTNANNNTLAAIIGDNGGATSLTKSGTGTWLLTGENTFSGGTTISAGSLQVGDGGTSGTLGTGNVVNNAALVINRSNAITVSNVISGSGALTQTGSGTTTLTGNNSYSGATTITSGTLQVGNGGVSGTLGSGNVVNNASLVINRSDTTTIANIIDGSGSLTQGGSGTTTLTGNNTYSGTTTIVSGVLSVSSLANGGSSSNLGSSTNAEGNLVLDGGTLRYTGGSVSSDRLFSLGTGGGVIDSSGTGALNFTSTGSMGFNGQTGARTLLLTGSGSGTNIIAASIGDNGGATAVTIAGSATWLLTGSNTYTGATTISSGVLRVGSGPGSVSSTLNSAVILSGAATLELGGINTTVASLAGAGTVQNNSSTAATLTTGGNDTSTSFSGIIHDGGSGALSLIKAGSGQFTLTGNHTYSGTTTISAGTLQIGSGGTTGTLGTGNVVNNASLVVNRSDDVIISNFISGSGSLTQSGSGTTALTGNNTYSGTTTISAGTLQIGDGSTSGALGTGNVVNYASLVVNRSDDTTIANVVSGSGSLTQSGSGITTLTGDSTYSGSTVISGGVLSVSHLADGGSNSNIGASSNASGNLVLNSGTLRYTGSSASTDHLFSIGTNGGNLDASGTGAISFTNTGNMGFNGSGSRTLGLTGTNSDANTISSLIGDNGGTTSVTKSGAGTWVLTAAHTYTGATTVNAGVLQVGNGGTNGSLSNSSAITTNATLAFNRSDTITQGTDFAAVISGNGGVTQTGLGTLALNGANTYAGATSVNSGTVEVTADHALGSTADGTTVKSGASLALNNVNYSLSEALSINGSGISIGGALVNSGTSSYAGMITARTDAVINAGGGTLNLTGGLVKDGTVLTLTGGGMINISGTGISGATVNSDLVVDATTVVVGADSNYNGPTTIQNNATLIANASLTTTQLNLDADSTLAGMGSIISTTDRSMFINGTLSIGDSRGTPVSSSLALTTSGAGSIVLGSGSSIQMDLFSGAGLGDHTANNTAADSINLHGRLDPTNGAILVLGNPNGMTNFHGGDKWRLFELNLGDANAGSITSALAFDDSSLKLARGFTGDLDETTGIYTVIDTNGALAMAAAGSQALIAGGNLVTSDLNNHIFSLQTNGVEPSGSISSSLDEGVIVGQGDGAPDKTSPVVKRMPISRQWTVFSTLNYGNVRLSPIRSQSGVQVDSWAPGIGVERYFARGLMVGFAASLLHSDQGYSGNAGSLQIEGPALSTYISYARRHFWTSMLYTFGSYDLNSTRNPGPGFQTAFGSTRTHTNALQYNVGWNFRFQGDSFVTGPFAGVDYLDGSVRAYSETGGGLAAARYDTQSYKSLVCRIGWSASKEFRTDFARITPLARVSYERQNLNNNGTSLSLINVPFSSQGGSQSPGQDYVVMACGLNFGFNNRLSVMLSYQGQFFRRDMQAHFGGLRFIYQY